MYLIFQDNNFDLEVTKVNLGHDDSEIWSHI